MLFEVTAYRVTRYTMLVDALSKEAALDAANQINPVSSLWEEDPDFYEFHPKNAELITEEEDE